MDTDSSPSTSSMDKNKESFFQKYEMNKLDSIIENDTNNEKKLTNDICEKELNVGFRKNEIKSKIKSNPTPVILVKLTYEVEKRIEQ